MAQKDTPQTAWKHESAVYWRYTLIHFGYALVLTVPLAIVLLALDLELALIVLLFVEAIGFAALPHLARVRRLIDARVEARKRFEASMVRSVLLLRMSDAHRLELAQLEKIAASMRERTDTAGAENDCLGVEQLIELYVRLAIAHRDSRAALDAVGRSVPDDEIALLEAIVASEGQQIWIERRLRILRLRRDARRAAIDEQIAIDRDLDLIGHTLRFMQEHCAAPGVETLRAELDIAFSSREHDAATLRELASLHATEFDTDVIRLGRDVTTPPSEVGLVRIAVAEPVEVEEAVRVLPTAMSSTA